MRKIRWSPAAAEDLRQIFHYIRNDNPDAAERVIRTIYRRVTGLASHPYQGRPGRVEGTRELALPPLPFIVVYRTVEGGGVIELANIIHGAQRWPPN